MKHESVIYKCAVWAVGGAFLIEVLVNALFGYRIAGVPLMAVTVSIAFMGAFCGIAFRDVHGLDAWAWIRRTAFGLVFFACLAFSQWSGWSVFSQMLADGSVINDVTAKQGSVARDELTRLEAQQKKVGVTRAVATIENEINAALNIVIKQTGKTVREATRECADPSYAPSTCRKVDGLKTELATAKEAASLPERIASQLAAVGKAPKVASGDAYMSGAERVFGAGKDDLRHYFVLFVTALIGIIANLGPALIGLAGPGGNSPPGARAGGDWGAPGPQGPHPHSGHYAPQYAGYPPPQYWPHYQPRIAAPAQEVLPPQHARSAQPGHHTQHAPVHYGAPQGAPQSMHGAPINIHFGAAAPLPPHAAAAPISAPATASFANPPEQTFSRVAADVPALPPPEPASRPVATGRLKEIIDQLLTFEAACIVAMQGAVVTADELLARYRSWAGGRAMGAVAFLECYGEYSALATRREFGGQVHFEGIQLREQRLQVAG